MPNELITEHRCQRVLPSGQCANDALPGMDRCEQHAGKNALKRSNTRNFQINDARVTARLDQLLASEGLFSLKEEIAITRQLGEKFMDAMTCDDSEESKLRLLMQAPMILRIIDTLQKLVVSGAQLEVKLSGVLTKEALYVLARQMVRIISEEISHVEDSSIIVDKITTRFADEISAAQNKEEN